MKVSNVLFLDSLKKQPIKNIDGCLFFLGEKSFLSYEKAHETGVNKAKTFFKKWPGLYVFTHRLIAPAFSFLGVISPSKIIKKYFSEDVGGKIMINIGSGTRRIHPDVINIDIYNFKNVDVVADVVDLPFKDGAVDFIVIEECLEHLDDPYAAIKEITRITKPGGYLYITTPFIYPFHASPNDYRRWTLEGLKKDFKDFNVVKSGVVGGPMGALQAVLMHSFALVLSFNNKFLYYFWVNFFMFILAPIKIFDLFFMLFRYSGEVASDIYFFGRKKSN